jgi:hypothetical protein
VRFNAWRSLFSALAKLAVTGHKNRWEENASGELH